VKHDFKKRHVASDRHGNYSFCWLSGLGPALKARVLLQKCQWHLACWSISLFRYHLAADRFHNAMLIHFHRTSGLEAGRTCIELQLSWLDLIQVELT
jgi:hypothetical protein